MKASSDRSVTQVPASFAMPEGQGARLEIPPRLESWNRSDHPDQVRLREFVAHVRELIDPIASDIGAPLAFHLHVGLDDSIDPLWQRDLDNYLFPIARQLPHDYVSVWGTKGRGRDSFVTVGPARAVAPPDWPSHRIPRAPGSENRWKRAVRDAVAYAKPIPPGPVGMQISLKVGPGRSWSSMWKRTIDGLDGLLGRTYPDREWNPQDGRIVRLGLHMQTDQALGHDVEATIWERQADEAWPELRWLTSMKPAQRAAYLAAHAATLQQTARQRAGSTGLRGHTRSRRLQRGRPRHPTSPLPVGLTEILTEEAFDGAIAAGGLMLKTDAAGPPKIHSLPEQCSGITKENFTMKVIIGGGKNGRYYTLTDPAAAKQRWPRLVVCGICRRLDPVRADALEAEMTGSANPDA